MNPIEQVETLELRLSEMQHRMKNHLQVISSFLALQAGSIGNDSVKAVLNDCQTRIESISLLYEILYAHPTALNVSVPRYFSQLVGMLLQSVSLPGKKIKLDLDIDDIEIHVDQLMNFGLIVNEIVTNSLKYAFKNRKTGVIRVVLKQQSWGPIHFEIGDNGVGFPKGFDWTTSNTFGIRMIRLLVQNQLNAKLAVIQTRGVVYKAEIPKLMANTG